MVIDKNIKKIQEILGIKTVKTETVVSKNSEQLGHLSIQFPSTLMLGVERVFDKMKEEGISDYRIKQLKVALIDLKKCALNDIANDESTRKKYQTAQKKAIKICESWLKSNTRKIKGL